MSSFDRRSMLGASMGAGAALLGGPAAAADGAPADPYVNDGVEKWVVDDTSAVADTDSGKVVGYVRNGIKIFMGVPYGEILSPEGRWARAAKVRPWTGKRSSRSPGPVCTPTAGNATEDEALYRNADYQAFRSAEDCLRVNIWTPGTDNKKRQVLFYCHGGGFNNGSSMMAMRFEGHNLAKYGDVVVVSLNHRLNAFGFLDLTAYGPRYAESADLGMLDVVDALKWVRTNIANFGGDPSKVMIFGHSGGGAKVLTLLAMPEAKGLFNRAVVQSPGPMPILTREKSAGVTAGFLKQVGVAPANIEALHKLPAETIANAASVLNVAFNIARERADLAGTAFSCAAVVDGHTVLYDPTLPTVASDVPVMIGTALHESYTALGHPEYVSMKEPQARELVREYFGSVSNEIYDVYRGAFPKAIPFELAAMAKAMGHFRAHSVKIAQRRATLGAAPTYNYWIHWRAGTFEGRAMAHHEIEMALVFMNSNVCPNVTGGTAEARALSVKMTDAWLAFARTGNPNIKALPAWSPVTPTAVSTMVFDNTCRIDHGSDLAAIETFWKNRYPKG